MEVEVVEAEDGEEGGGGGVDGVEAHGADVQLLPRQRRRLREGEAVSLILELHVMQQPHLAHVPLDVVEHHPVVAGDELHRLLGAVK